MADGKAEAKARRQTKTGTLRLQPNGRFQAIVRRHGHDPISKTFLTKTEAETWLRKTQADIDRGTYASAVAAERTTFRDFAKRFSNDYAPNHYRGEAWKYKVANLVERLGNLSLVAINVRAVTKYRDDRLKDPDPRFKDPTNAPKISGSTVKSELDLLSKMLRVAPTEFGISLPLGNPVIGIKKPASNPGRERRISDDEWARLLRECKGSRNAWLLPAVVLSVESSMRQGEGLSMLWENVDLENKLVMLPDPEKIKNGEPRAVPLSTRAIAVLKGLHPKPTGLVFPLPRRTLYGAYRRAALRAGITNLTFHDLRHEALSRLAER